MPTRSAALIALGSLLLLLSLGTRLVIYGAENQAEELGNEAWESLASDLNLGNLRGQEALESANATSNRNARGKSLLLSSEPQRALVRVTGTSYRTPTLVPEVAGDYIITTSFRMGTYSASELESKAAVLPYKTPFLILVWLYLPGLVCLGLGWKFLSSNTAETPPKERPSTIKDRSSSLDTVLRTAPPVPPDGLFEHDSNTPQENRFGRFVKGERVGVGAMGEVFRCTSCVDGDKNTYALKVLLPEWSSAEDFRTRFEREADVCRKFAHPNLVRAYDHGEKDGRLWLVMDFVDGVELEAWMQDRRHSENEIRRMFLSIFQGLDHAHKVGVVHRDLKPGNILIRRENDEPVIADFGLAKGKHYATITKTNTTLGTPTYIAPEQITGGKGSPQSDLYSLGCVMYEALTGHPPFEEKDVMKLLTLKLIEETPPAMPEESASAEMRAIVEKLLSHSVEGRYQSAAEVIGDLQSEA